MSTSIIQRLPDCSYCSNERFIFAPSSNRNNTSYLEICSCVEQHCICDKKPPYLYLNEATNIVQSCICKNARNKLSKIKSLFSDSNIPTKYKYRRITDFKTDNEDNTIKNSLFMALDDSVHFINQSNNLQNKFIRGLFFYGAPGSGKTLLTCLILNECIIKYQIEVLYLKITRDFFNRIKASYNLESEIYGQGDDLFKKISEVDLLAIDDFGVQKDSLWEQRTLYDLIDTRYEFEKPTIITSNLDPKEIDNLFSGRIYSRLKEMVQFKEIIAPDYRDKFQEDDIE